MSDASCFRIFAGQTSRRRGASRVPRGVTCDYVVRSRQVQLTRSDVYPPGIDATGGCVSQATQLQYLSILRTRDNPPHTAVHSCTAGKSGCGMNQQSAQRPARVAPSCDAMLMVGKCVQRRSHLSQDRPLQHFACCNGRPRHEPQQASLAAASSGRHTAGRAAMALVAARLLARRRRRRCAAGGAAKMRCW